MEVDKNFLYRLNNIAQEAGKIILTFYEKSEVSVKEKSDSSPVTEADFAASDYIVSALKKEFPEIPSLSEESSEEVFQERLKWDEYFLIDPLDGTKEFIKKSSEFTVNIALIRKGRVVAGVVDVPVLRETYYGNCEESFICREGIESKLPLVPYDKDILRVVSTKSHKNTATEEFIEKLKGKFPKVEAKTFGSSLKICKVAEGVADMNPRLGTGTKEWDIAAAHAVLKGAGGDIFLLNTKISMNYNKESLHNPEYEARRKELC